MAHPIEHAKSSARRFGGRPEDYSRFMTGSMSRKATLRIFAIAVLDTMRRAFSWPRRSSATPS